MENMLMEITKSSKLSGRILKIDPESETIILMERDGETIGSLTIEELIFCIMDPEVIQKRNSQRIKVLSTACTVKVRTKNGETFEDGIIKSIGRGGAFIEFSTPLPLDTILELTLISPSNEEVNITASVVWTRNKIERYIYFPGMGVKFLNIEDKEKLSRLIDKSKNIVHPF